MSTPLDSPDQGGVATLDRELEELLREENLEPGDLLLCQVDQIDLALEFVTGLFQQPGARPISNSLAQFAAAAVAVLGIMG